MYGMSLAHYQRRARLAWAIAQLLQSDACIESIALRAGYKSTASFYTALRSLTDLSPTQVRRLSSEEVRELLDGPLNLGLVRPPQGALKPAGRLGTVLSDASI